MSCVPLRNLCYMNFNINNYFTMFQNWNENKVFSTFGNPRKKSGLIYFNACSGLYKHDGKKFAAKPGDIFYLPPHAEYSTTFTNCTDDPSTILIDFWLTDENGNEIYISDSIFKAHTDSADNFFKKIFCSVHSQNTLPMPNVAAIKTELFNLLSLLAKLDKISHLTKKEMLCIKPGMEYLESDIKQKKSIKQIADMCLISETYFRKLFKAYYGISPNQFRIERKIEKAKALIADGTHNITEISDILGFENVSYFCRIFKKYTGLSPKSYKEK